MFARLSSIFVAALAASVVVAVPNPSSTPCTSSTPAPPAPTPPAGGQCNTGSIQCCNSVQDPSSPQVGAIAGLLGIVVDLLSGSVGVGCTPVSVIGTGSGSQCTQQPVCCNGDSFSGLIVIGCSPIIINL